ncbi:uncharacterized protein LOC103519911, partial [Diaphorina citri]|uniref:Uncharacterized protein LOC103519911 n=1 Tax=Diaphorina citri TaxID=121845 RepID=A0A3Q0JF38_DIACI
WNFSVGQHDLKFLPDENSDCHHNVRPPVQVHLKVIVPEGLLCAMSKEEPNKNSDCHHNVRPPVQVHLKVIVPEGLLCAMSKEEPNKVLWQHKGLCSLTSADLTQSKPSASRTKNTNQKPTAARTNPMKPAGSLFTNNFITNSAMFRNLSNSLRYRQTSNTMDHSDSVVFEHSQESESLSSLLSPAKGKAVPDDDEDSYIQFEASQADTHGVQSSVIDISSSSGGKDKLQVPQPQPRKRPNSLSIGPVDGSTGSSKLYLYIQMQLCRKDSLREWLADNVTHRTNDLIRIFSGPTSAYTNHALHSIVRFGKSTQIIRIQYL